MLKIGWSKRDVSTERHIIIPAQHFIRCSKGVLDPIMLTALTLDDGNDYVIFLGADLPEIKNGVLKEIRERVIQKNPNINAEKIIMNCTHTHTGPLVIPDDNTPWGNFEEIPHDGVDIVPPSEYFEFFVSNAVDAIVESFEAKKEGLMAFGYGYATVSHSRRTVYNRDMTEGSDNPYFRLEEGRGKMYGKTKLPEFSHFEAGSDPHANFMFTFDKDEKLTGAIVNIPCPSQNMEMEYYLSSDFWGDVREKIAENYGNIYIMPQCAAAGDLAPRKLFYNDAEERRFKLKYSDIKIKEDLVNGIEVYRRKDIALQICTAFDEVYSWAQKEKYGEVPIIHSVKMVELDRRIITEEEYKVLNEKENYIPKPLVCTDDKTADLKWNSLEIYRSRSKDIVLGLYEEQNKGKKYKTEIHVIKVGNIAFATNQFELYMDYAHRIQARSPFVQTFIVQLCAQPHANSATYIATERGAENRGYSANLFSNRVSPKGGQELVEETLNELNKLHSS